jgi:hypothetical protein
MYNDSDCISMVVNVKLISWRSDYYKFIGKVVSGYYLPIRVSVDLGIIQVSQSCYTNWFSTTACFTVKIVTLSNL